MKNGQAKVMLLLPDRLLFLFGVIKWLFRLLRIRQQSGYDS